MNTELPTLPMGCYATSLNDWDTVYTADQMREYGRLCRATAGQANDKYSDFTRAELVGLLDQAYDQINTAEQANGWGPSHKQPWHESEDAEQAGKVEACRHDVFDSCPECYVDPADAKPTQPAATQQPEHADNCACLRGGDRECNCHLAYGFSTAEAMQEHDETERAKRVPAKPVAWLYRFKIDGEWTNWRVSDHTQKTPLLRDYEEQPLYAAPVSPSREVEALYQTASRGFHVSETCGPDRHYVRIIRFRSLADLQAYEDAWTDVMVAERDRLRVALAPVQEKAP